MQFDELDRKMRIFETAHDYCVPEDFYMVARIDGRNFTNLTRNILQAEAPFDTNFRDAMVTTVERLMACGFNVTYGYTQSDEISLLFSLSENLFSRKLRKYNSILAGEASAAFSLAIQTHAAFDCRISILPNIETVKDYFCWRMEDAFRNSLNAYDYWTLRKDGKNDREATEALLGMSVASKNELLFQHGINFNNVPVWQKRGIGFFWENYEKEGVNPLTQEKKIAIRRRFAKDFELPQSIENYRLYLANIIQDNSQEQGKESWQIQGKQ